MHSRGSMYTGPEAASDELNLPKTEESSSENPLHLNPEFSDVAFDRKTFVGALDENIATVQYGAEVVSHSGSDTLLTGNTDPEKHVKHTIGETSGIVIRLRKPCSFNHIRMKLYDGDKRYYSYYIETSQDQKIWHRIVDYSGYPCRSVQNLYFDPQVSQYIKVVGTSATVGNDFRLVFLEAFDKSQIPRMQNGIIRPEANITTPENGAIVIEGGNPKSMLNGDHHYASYHPINSDELPCIMVQLPQPYVISSMRLLLRESCKYVIETSVNKKDWKIAIDRRNRRRFPTGWQDLEFAERVVVFIKITGTEASEYYEIACYHFESPSDGKK